MWRNVELLDFIQGRICWSATWYEVYTPFIFSVPPTSVLTTYTCPLVKSASPDNWDKIRGSYISA